MSKRRKRHFNAQSQVTANYMDSFLKSKSGDTDEEKPNEATEGSLAATNTEVPGNIAATADKGKPQNVFQLLWIAIKVIVVLAAFVGVIWGIGWYFWNLEQRVFTASDKVSKIEITLNEFSIETKEWRSNIVDSLDKLRSNVNTFIESFSKPREPEAKL